MVKKVGEVSIVDKEDNTSDNTMKVEFPNIGRIWVPEKAMKKLIPWLPVDFIVQVSNGPDV